MNAADWYLLRAPETCASPCLLVYPERIEHNIRQMIRMAGGTRQLRPHVKTHKMAEIIQMQMKHGISRFKCATIAEAELLGVCQAPDVLLAMQPVGLNLERFLNLSEAFPKTTFATIVDDAGIAKQLNSLATDRNRKVPVYMDINVGMDRTGIRPDADGFALYRQLCSLPNLDVHGFHVYDGHLRNTDPIERQAACDAAFAPVSALKDQLEAVGLEVPGIVAGGSPTFPIHARRKGVQTSPGTTLLWDERYESSFPDMPFLPAAVLLLRIISKPGKDLLCLDLGHKAIAAEMPFPRLKLLGMEDCEQLSQSEEHLVVRCPSADSHALGDVCYAIPVHICPTVAKYPKVLTVAEGKITGSWNVAARDHSIRL